MESWISSTLGGIWSDATSLASATKALLLGLWHRLIDAFQPVKAAWGELEHAFDSITAQLENLGMNTWRALHHLVSSWIPRMVGAALHTVEGWIASAVGTLKGWAIAALSQLRDWAAAALAQLSQWAHDAVDWLTNRLGQAWDWIDQIGRRVADLVLHPELLAEWVFDPLWRFAVRQVRDHAAPLGRWLLRAGIATTISSAHVAEDVLTTLFL